MQGSQNAIGNSQRNISNFIYTKEALSCINDLDQKTNPNKKSGFFKSTRDLLSVNNNPLLSYISQKKISLRNIMNNQNNTDRQGQIN